LLSDGRSAPYVKITKWMKRSGAVSAVCGLGSSDFSSISAIFSRLLIARFVPKIFDRV